MRENNDIVVAIEPGESFIRLVVARQRGDSLRVLTYAEEKSSGIERGRVTDPEALAEAIYTSIRTAERELGIPIEKVILTVPSSVVRSNHSDGTVEASGSGRAVIDKDGARALSRARHHEVDNQELEFLHLIPTYYTLDDAPYGQLPIGVKGRELTAFACTLSGESGALQALRDVISLVGLQEPTFVATSIASSLGALTHGEQQLGAILLDIGTTTTTLSLVRYGHLLDTTTIPVGGHHLTNDLSIGLEIPYEVAEVLKTEYGTVDLELGSAEMTVPCPDGTEVVLNRVEAISILHDRAQEILTLAHERLASAGYGDVPPGGIVLSGASAYLDGIVPMASDIFGAPVHVSQPRGLEGIPPGLQKSSWIAVVGALTWASTLSDADQAQRAQRGGRQFTFNLTGLLRATYERLFGRKDVNLREVSEAIYGNTASAEEGRIPEAVGLTGTHRREE